jgi:hypothetical protein
MEGISPMQDESNSLALGTLVSEIIAEYRKHGEEQ